MNSFCKAAWLITLCGDCVGRAVDTLTASHDVIHADPSTTSLSIHLEDQNCGRPWWPSGQRCRCTRPAHAEQANFAHQGFVSRFIPLSRCPDVTEVGHLHDLCSKSPIISASNRRMSADGSRSRQVVALKEGTLDIHSANTPSFGAGKEDHEVLAQPWECWWLSVELGLHHIFMFEALQDDSRMGLVLLVAQEKAHGNQCAFGASGSVHRSPCVILGPWRQSFSLGLDKRLAFFRAQTAFDHRLQDLFLSDDHADSSVLACFCWGCPSWARGGRPSSRRAWLSESWPASRIALS